MRNRPLPMSLIVYHTQHMLWLSKRLHMEGRIGKLFPILINYKVISIILSSFTNITNIINIIKH